MRHRRNIHKFIMCISYKLNYPPKISISTATHELEQWPSLRSVRPAADKDVLFLNESCVNLGRNAPSQIFLSSGTIEPPPRVCCRSHEHQDKIDKVKQVATFKNSSSISPPPPLQKKIYASTKYLYFWLKSSHSTCEYLGFVVRLFFPSPFTSLHYVDLLALSFAFFGF